MFANPHQPRAPRRVNPVNFGTALGVLGGVAFLAGGTALAMRVLDKQAPSGAPQEHPLSGIFVPGATLAGSTRVTAALRLPIAITTFDLSGDGEGGPTTSSFPLVTQAEHLTIRSKQGDVYPLDYITARPNGEASLRVDQMKLMEMGIGHDVTGEVTYADGTPDSAKTQILRLVTDLLTTVTDDAFDAATKAIVEDGAAFNVPSGTRDAFVQGFLQSLNPNVAWPADPSGLQAGTPEFRAWMGVDLVSQVAYQVAWNNQTA